MMGISCTNHSSKRSGQLEVSIESTWPSIMPDAKKLNLVIGMQKLTDVRLELEQPYRLMSDRPIKEPTGFSFLFTAFYDQRGCWLELDTVRSEIRLNTRKTMILNYDYHHARPFGKPLKIKLMSNNKLLNQTTIIDTTSAAVLLYRWR